MKLSTLEIIAHSDRLRAANRWSECFFREVESRNQKTIVGLCGGRSIVPLLEQLVERAEDISRERWGQIEFFMVDERLVPLDDEASNFRSISPFLARLIEGDFIVEGQIHPFCFDPQREDLGLVHYNNEFAKHGGLFDIALLGVGEDGHVAALFPRHRVLEQEEARFVAFDDSPKLPAARMTCTLQLLARAGMLTGIVFGHEKGNALQRLADQDISLVDCPAKVITCVPNAYIVTDLVNHPAVEFDCKRQSRES